MTRHTADWWAERLEELGETGDAAAMARRHGVRLGTLVWWRSELRRRRREGAGPRLLPVVVRASRPACNEERGASLELVVEVGSARITVRGAVTAEHLAAIVSTAAGSC
jgi:transposase-like protein